jgi:hypothetical protein
MRYAAYSPLVYRQAQLLCLTGRREEADAYLNLARRAYPSRLPEFREGLGAQSDLVGECRGLGS